MQLELHRPHTMREFLEYYYPELLEAAESGCTLLTELQNSLIELLPMSKKLLPSNIEQLADAEAQANFMTYIYYYSLFSFADKAYTILNKQCTALAKALDANDAEDEKKGVENLEKTLDALRYVPFDTLLNHSAVGLLRLDIFKEYLCKSLDFPVILRYDENGNRIGGFWTFRKITCTMVINGLSHKQLLTDCINAPLPDSTTIGKVVDDGKEIEELDIFDFNNIPMSELDKAYIDYEPLYDTVDWYSVDEDYLYEERKNLVRAKDIEQE